jgi:omega-6 fatty acid desaturase (delta-12 desaturase)
MTFVTAPSPDGTSWSARLARWRRPDPKRSIWQLASTAVFFVVGWILMYFSLRVSYWLTLVLAIPTAFMLVRLFIVQHDCGHGSFFKSAKVADLVGSVLGVFTLTPYHYWKRAHAIHHATSGNLDHRGFGDINTLTVEEYSRLSFWGRLKYRLYRNPIVLFGIGPVYMFLIEHRIPTIAPRGWSRERRSIIINDLGLVALIAMMAWLIGPKALLAVHVPVLIVSCTAGVWLFYVQHQFDTTYWEHDGRWQYETAALAGCSYYKLPKVLQWCTGNIGIHHVHHLHAGIPNYFLPKVMERFPELQQAPTLTMWQSFKCVPLALWDEQMRRLVSFREARRRARVTA